MILFFKKIEFKLIQWKLQRLINEEFKLIKSTRLKQLTNYYISTF